jgi:hypothetical protein
MYEFFRPLEKCDDLVTLILGVRFLSHLVYVFSCVKCLCRS